MANQFDLYSYGILNKKIYRNPPPPLLYEMAIQEEESSIISQSGALIVYSGEKTGRNPKDKRIVKHPESQDQIWWDDRVNIPMDESAFLINRQRAVDYLNTRKNIYVVDAYAGWDPRYRQKIRIICSRPYHALFMHNMLINPTLAQLENFRNPDYLIINAGEFPANQLSNQVLSKTTVNISLEKKEMIILGTQYAGEMKKGVFSIMNYIMPPINVLSMHCSANQGIRNDDVSLLFGLSGTGKTTLSADPNRRLIGDDEHCWSDHGIFNIEGGCYAKAINLSFDKEPQIFNAIRFGTILENVYCSPKTREVNYFNDSITQNTRASYPIHYIPDVKIPCIGNHPKNVIFLTCDAFGVLPPISKLNSNQAAYHFISGYTAKIAGTEIGINKPQATFSPCFGAAFLIRHPWEYTRLFIQKIKKYQSNVWLINTGWFGGPFGIGKRFYLDYTRSMINAIHSDEINQSSFSPEPFFGLMIPNHCPNVPDHILSPKNTWKDPLSYNFQASKLSSLFKENFDQFKNFVPTEVLQGGPLV